MVVVIGLVALTLLHEYKACSYMVRPTRCASTQNIQRPESTQTEDAFIAPIKATFTLLERGFHSHAFGILVDPRFACVLVGNQDPALLELRLPARTHIRFNRVFLPDLGPPKPLLSSFVHKCVKAAPATPLVAHLTLTGMFLTHPQQIMPSTIATELHQWESGSSSVRDQGTVSLLQMLADLIEQAGNNGPLLLFPFLHCRHDCPSHR